MDDEQKDQPHATPTPSSSTTSTTVLVEPPDHAKEEASALYMAFGGLGFVVWVLLLWGVTGFAKEWAKTGFGFWLAWLEEGTSRTSKAMAKTVPQLQRATIRTLAPALGGFSGPIVGPVIGSQFGRYDLAGEWSVIIGVVAGTLAVGLATGLDRVDLGSLLEKVTWSGAKAAVGKVAGEEAAASVEKTQKNPPVGDLAKDFQKDPEQ